MPFPFAVSALLFVLVLVSIFSVWPHFACLGKISQGAASYGIDSMLFISKDLCYDSLQYNCNIVIIEENGLKC